jgi:WD40 repeat protein
VVPFVVIGGGDGSEDRHFRVRFALSGHDKFVSSPAFSPDGSKTATGSSDSAAKLWNASTGALITTLNGHTKAVTSVAFSPDGSRLVTAGSDDTVKVWSAGTGALITTLTDHESGLNPGVQPG